MRKKIEKQVWLVPHPTSQFKEDVKTLALQNNLKIVDARFAGGIDPKRIASKTPKLTAVRGEAAEKAGEE